ASTATECALLSLDHTCAPSGLRAMRLSPRGAFETGSPAQQGRAPLSEVAFGAMLGCTDPNEERSMRFLTAAIIMSLCLPYAAGATEKKLLLCEWIEGDELSGVSIKRAEAVFLFYDADNLVDIDLESGCAYEKEVEIEEEYVSWSCRGEREHELMNTKFSEVYELSRLSGNFQYFRSSESIWKLEERGIEAALPNRSSSESRSGSCRPAERAF
ncbi:MAG: hypothetical protein AAGG47_21335, partial [Pseudomonadota bacterium]